MTYNPQIDTILKKGSNGAGVLLLHGFTGTPDSLRPLINALHESGYTVLAPLLAGHGTTPEQCEKTNWKDWLESAKQGLLELKERHSKVFIGGLSLGSLLSLKLAIEFSRSLSAMTCLATPLELNFLARTAIPLISNSPLRLFWKYQKKIDVDIKDPMAKENFWNYTLMPISCINSIITLQNLVRSSLSKIETPTLLIHSRHDSTAPYYSMNQVALEISSKICETVTLENSKHVITIDYDKDLLAEKVVQFFNRFL